MQNNSYATGRITSEPNTLALASDGLLLGVCTENDSDLTQCSGGQNWDQDKARTYCNAGRAGSGIKITCKSKLT